MTRTTDKLTPSLQLMQRGPFVPARNAAPAVLAVKHAHLWDKHVAPVNALADRVADAEGLKRGLVPYVDPQLAGVDATVLALLDNPSTKAEAGTGSGLLSLENDDLTARNCAKFYNAFGLTPDRVVHWNVAPAPIAGAKNGRSSASERVRGARWLRELLELLPNLRVILLMGDMARDGWMKSGLDAAGVVIPQSVPHPSGKGMANIDAHLRLHRGMVATMTALDGPGRRFPPEPAPSAKRTPHPARRPARAAGQAPALTPAPAEPELSNGELWGWWPTFEHYSSPGSHPWGTSRSQRRVEAAIDRHTGPPARRVQSPALHQLGGSWRPSGARAPPPT
ncbi:hypothetical protein M3E00_15955 [Dietzia cinnamea]|uniref:hypothetical protein n=1 Tax=Dietzia cinnamea TaxID=321318 RepID=UPI0021A359F2|nr:hypothetical protein [Dietzia cinnamea]MCT2100060.1 hypothetical protein [Dietzia cinnamea]